MKKAIITGGPGTIEDSIPALSRALFRGDLNNDQIRKLSGQQLYFALKNIGLESSIDILEIITSKQYLTLLDFEFWTRDSFREDRFWAWLEAIDDPQNLLPFQRLLSCIDSTVLSFVIRKYVDVVYNEEATDAPPGPNFYTPDGGSTWLCIKTHDPERHRLFGKLLAFLYQTNIEFFYRLLMQAGEGTSIEFEEIGFNEKSKRLQTEDIPTFEDAQPYHRIITLQKFLEIFDKTTDQNVVDENSTDVIVKPSAFFSGVRYQPFLAALEEVSEPRLYEIQSEVARILNCAVIFFLNDFGEEDQLKLLSEQVFGIINVGLQMVAKERPNVISNQGMSEISFTNLYRLGLSAFYDLRSIAQKVPEDIFGTLNHMNEALYILVECCRKNLPCIPNFLREDGTFELSQEGEKLEFMPIYSLEQINAMKGIILGQIMEKSKEIRSYETEGKKHAIAIDGLTSEPQ